MDRLERAVTWLLSTDKSNLLDFNSMRKAIEDCGLFYDNRKSEDGTKSIYGDDVVHMINQSSHGLWQTPIQLAQFLVKLSELDIKTYLDVGTCSGYTITIVCAYLQRFGLIHVDTIEPVMICSQAVKNLWKKYDMPINYITSTSEQMYTSMPSDKYDFIFIDGNHEYPFVKADYENFKNKCKYLAFHDINDRLCPGVRKVWQEVKEENAKTGQFDMYEYIDHPNGYTLMGIGLCVSKVLQKDAIKSREVKPKYKMIVVTPAGRQRYLEILYKHLQKQTADFNKWILWLNTESKSDIEYCKALAEQNEWIECRNLSTKFDGTHTIHTFFRECVDPDTIYIRLDDDIVWLENGFLNNMYNFRIANPDYFLVYGNIVNNNIIDHIHHRLGVISRFIDYDCIGNGWKEGTIAQEVHNCFLDSIKNNDIDRWKFSRWVLSQYERVSINCICFFGSEFAKFNGEVDKAEETWLSSVKPKSIKTPNIINGDALMVHFSFYSQREYLESKTKILEMYKQLADA